MSFLQMTGTLLNVLTTTARTDKDGKPIPARHQIQLQVESPLENGDRRIDLQTLTVGDRSQFDARVGQPVTIPVGVFVSGGKLQFFVPRVGASGARTAAGGPDARSAHS
jgi:hypothetical protein